MTIAAILDATRTALAGVIGHGWSVDVTDDAWSALELLGQQPSGVRALLLAEDFISDPVHPKGLAGNLLGRLVVQIPRGLEMKDAKPQGRLHAAEERARRALLSIVFQLPDAPDYTEDWTTSASPPHPEVTGFRQIGAGPYKSPDADLLLQHPAREIRWAVFLALRLPSQNLRVDLPLDAGN